MDYKLSTINSLGGTVPEIIIILIVFVLLFLTALVIGKSRMVAFNLAFYPAILIYLYLPVNLLKKISYFGDTGLGIFWNNILIFFFFFLLSFIVIYAITGRTLAYRGRKKLSLGALAIAALILVLLVIHQVVPLPNKEELFPMIGKAIFGREQNFVWILTAALLTTVAFGRK